MNSCFIVVILFSLRCQVNSQIITENKSCSGVTVNNLIGKGITISSNETLLLKVPSKGNNLNICQSNWTCCSRQLEDRLYNVSGTLLKDELHLKINPTTLFFDTQASLFDVYFRNLLKRATVKWDNMLSAIYNDKYKANRQIFLTLFASLQNYYANGTVNLTDATDLFFKQLLNRILWITHPNLNGKTDFFACVAKNIYVIKPFGHFQTRISSELTGSLHIARTFTKALKVASTVSGSLSKELLTRKCFENFTRIHRCSICQGVVEAPVCEKTCDNVLKLCFQKSHEIDRKWNEYIRQLQSVAKAMDGQYNLESVAGQLGFQISDSIMELQKNLTGVMKKIRLLCKTSGRSKRSGTSGSDFYLEGDKSRSKRSGSTLPGHFSSFDSQNSGRNNRQLDSLKSDFEGKLSGTKSIWMNLPNQICSDKRFATRNQTATCWNGEGLQRNFQSVPILKASRNKGDPSTNIEIQLKLLTFLTKESKKIFGDQLLPHHVDIEDDDDEDTHWGSGSGSGSGGESGQYSGETTTATLITTPADTTQSSRTSSAYGSGGYSTDITPTPLITEPGDDEEDNTGSGSGSGGNKIPNTSTEAVEADIIDNNVLNDHPDVSFDQDNKPVTVNNSNGAISHVCSKLFILYFLAVLFIYT